MMTMTMNPHSKWILTSPRVRSEVVLRAVVILELTLRRFAIVVKTKRDIVCPVLDTVNSSWWLQPGGREMSNGDEEGESNTFALPNV